MSESFAFFGDHDDDYEDDDSELYNSEDVDLEDPQLLNIYRQHLTDHFRAHCSKIVFARLPECEDVRLDYHLETYWYQKHFIMPELQRVVNADLSSRYFIWLAAEACFVKPQDELETCTRWSSYRLLLLLMLLLMLLMLPFFLSFFFLPTSIHSLQEPIMVTHQPSD